MKECIKTNCVSCTSPLNGSIACRMRGVSEEEKAVLSWVKTTTPFLVERERLILEEEGR